jgi:hypothetical protein
VSASLGREQAIGTTDRAPVRPQGAAEQAVDPPNHDALSPHLLRQGLFPKQHLGTIPDDSAQFSKTGGSNYVLVLS